MKNIILFLGILALASCHKDPQLGLAPSFEDAQFSYAETDTNENVIALTSNNPNILCQWDLGNGIKKEGNNVSAAYPYAGTYTVKLTVFNSGGSKSSTQQIVIAQDDLSLLNNPIYSKLTGGAAGPGLKFGILILFLQATWVLGQTLRVHLVLFQNGGRPGQMKNLAVDCTTTVMCFTLTDLSLIW